VVIKYHTVGFAGSVVADLLYDQLC
jgi:hypothetical protein